MPKKLSIGDAVFHGDPPVSYYITDLDDSEQTASIKTTGPRASVVHHDVEWSELTLLDATQNAARITREASEDG